MTRTGYDIVHDLLDLQLVDVDGRRVGRIDDVELTGSPPGISALLAGSGLYPRRVPRALAGLWRRWSGPERWGENAVRIPWEEVDEVGAVVRLRCKAREVGLGAGDEPRSWVTRRVPWN